MLPVLVHEHYVLDFAEKKAHLDWCFGYGKKTEWDFGYGKTEMAPLYIIEGTTFLFPDPINATVEAEMVLSNWGKIFNIGCDLEEIKKHPALLFSLFPYCFKDLWKQNKGIMSEPIYDILMLMTWRNDDREPNVYIPSHDYQFRDVVLAGANKSEKTFEFVPLEGSFSQKDMEAFHWIETLEAPSHTLDARTVDPLKRPIAVAVQSNGIDFGFLIREGADQAKPGVGSL